ncbi:hypothetical protein [Bosea sp. Root483D1]|uniref:hypothetical protein n=1 Tax=Bosea sp. Root483D1 TaxID=1736544 RepID=UPI000AB29B27|nr:hypothetical protein [Bosea sp. Root483D1]
MDNRKRALAEVASLDSWHKQFSVAQEVSELHVDVSFATGRIGEEAESPVRFELRLRRVEVVVIVPSSEPASVVISSVRRDTDNTKVTRARTISTRLKAQAGVEASTSLAENGLKARFKAAVGMSASKASEDTTRIVSASKSMAVSQIKTRDGEYAWAISPASSDALSGHPWNAMRSSLLSVRDERPDRSKGIEPSIRVELRCRREDLDFPVIHRKSGVPWVTNKRIAAEAVIRNRLMEAGLLNGPIDDPYATITLSAIIAESQA